MKAGDGVTPDQPPPCGHSDVPSHTCGPARWIATLYVLWYLWYDMPCQRLCVGPLALSRHQQQGHQSDRLPRNNPKACYSQYRPIFSLASKAGSKVPFLARLCPPPDVGNPWCEACRMRLRAEVSQASRVGLAGRMLGDAQQACCKRARGLTVFGAGGAGMREGRSLYTWLPVHSCRDAVPLRPFSSDCCASDLSIG